MHVKVFHGDRKVHSIRVSILDKIQVVIEKLKDLEPKEMAKYYNTKLIYPMGTLRNLSEGAEHTSFLMHNIPD